MAESEVGGKHRAAGQIQLGEVIIELLLQVIVAELIADHRHQLSEAGGAELTAVLVAQRAQLSEVTDQRLKQTQRALQDRPRLAVNETAEEDAAPQSSPSAAIAYICCTAARLARQSASTCWR